MHMGKRPLAEAQKPKADALGSYHWLMGDKQTEAEIGGGAAAKETITGAGTLVGVG